MKVAPRSPEELIHAAATMLGRAGPRQLAHFDPFPAPVYATDQRGTIVYYNPACIAFAGRTPALGVDQWCVSWKMRGEDGDVLPHDRCAMSIVVREGRQLRGVHAVAERPDGTLAPFHAYPTPAFNDDGDVVGAVNLLVPDDGAAHRELLATAAKCRNLAQWISDRKASDTLNHMASECECHAAVLRLN